MGWGATGGELPVRTRDRLTSLRSKGEVQDPVDADVKGVERRGAGRWTA